MRTPYQSHSPVEWEQIMNQYASSGLSQKAFCQREGPAPGTFSKWRKQLGFVPTQSATIGPPADFKPLAAISLPMQAVRAEPHEHHSDDWAVELTLGAGMTLRIRAPG